MHEVLERLEAKESALLDAPVSVVRVLVYAIQTQKVAELIVLLLRLTKLFQILKDGKQQVLVIELLSDQQFKVSLSANDKSNLVSVYFLPDLTHFEEIFNIVPLPLQNQMTQEAQLATVSV